MKIEYISNRTFSIQSELEMQVNIASEIVIATAFIDKCAIDLLENALLKNKQLKSLKLLIGLYGFFNKKVDLLRLNDIAAKYASKVQIQVSRNAHFHWKFYFFKIKRSEIYYTGSANFTNGGLKSNAEMLIKFTSDAKDKSGIDKTIKEFNKEWENSVAISSLKLDLYKENQSSKIVESKDLNFKGLFPEKELDQIEKTIVKSNKAVVLLLTHDLSAGTKRMVANNLPKWKEYLVLDRKAYFQNCLNSGKLLIISRESLNEFTWCWALLKDSADHLKTSDGNYFIEFKYEGKPKILTLNHIDVLKSGKFGIDIKARKSKFIQKVVGARQIEKLKALLK